MSLNTLPPELLQTILTHLPISSLLAFSLTSKSNHAHHFQALHTLDIAIFPKRVQALIAFLQSSSTDDDDITSSYPSNPYQLQSPHQIALIIPSPSRPSTSTRSRTKAKSTSKSKSSSTKSTPTPLPTPQSHRASIIHLQNHHLTTLLHRYPSLQNLTFHAWDLLPPLLTTLSSLRSLTSLTLHLDHSTSRDPCLPSSYFTDPAPPSPMWNSLAGLGEENARNLQLRNLKVLRLERVGCTSMQLRGMVGSNRKLRELRCRKVRGVDGEFLAWLGGEERNDEVECQGQEGEGQGRSNNEEMDEDEGNGPSKRAGLEILRIDTCPSLSLRHAADFTFLNNLAPSLKDFRIENCDGVDEVLLREACERVGLPIPPIAEEEGVVPGGSHGGIRNGVVEVDPMFCDPVSMMKGMKIGGGGGFSQVMEVDESCL